ncbi:MAG TPA: AAA family ATPase, partial [Burkholderiaceae bacterium]|nr:AAA family ATPase [Burkholderiaceae bacterium]
MLGPDVIATVPGRGYRFVAPLDNESASVTPRKASPSAHNKALPAHPLPLIGRDEELSELARYVSSQTLVTITGAGGMGKTRLALAVASLLADQWRDGVAWVEAASVFDPMQLLAAVAQAARVTLAGAHSADKIAVALQSHSMLLVIDNCEHLLEAARLLVQALRREAPSVHILLTSQAALRIQGEQIFTLQPLALPRANDAPDERFGALQLFAERARAVDRRFVLDASNGPVVADICRQLDGLPLAIELAAARVNLLGVHGLRDRLSNRLQLLTTGSHDVPQRHQTLRAALEWSHSFLGPAEQAVLRRLGVFVGGFTLDLAQQVAADGESGSLDSWAVLDALGTLVDRSLVSVDAGEPVRYRLLETMRVFALEQLATAGETAALRARHARVLADLFATIDESRFGDNGKASASEVAQRLQPEIDNARAALDWAVGAA